MTQISVDFEEYRDYEEKWVPTYLTAKIRENLEQGVVNLTDVQFLLKEWDRLNEVISRMHKQLQRAESENWRLHREVEDLRTTISAQAILTDHDDPALSRTVEFFPEDATAILVSRGMIEQWVADMNEVELLRRYLNRETGSL